MSGSLSSSGRRVVLVMVEPPLPFGNAAARWSYVLLKGLVARGHEVVAYATCSDAADGKAAKQLFPSPLYDLRVFGHCQQPRSWRTKWASLRRPRSYLFSEALRTDLAAELCRGFDVLHLEQLWSGWLGTEHVREAIVNVHYLVEIDLEDTRPESHLDALRLRTTRAAERHLLRRYTRIATLTPRLTERVRQISPKARVDTVPLALDLSLYPFHASGAQPAEPVLGLIGSFDWLPTYAAAVRLITRLWPRILARVPAARLMLVGRHAETALHAFRHVPHVTITGNVDDIQPYFVGTDVLLYAPPQGSGMKVKVLEAFALGTAVVCNGHGVEGIPAQDGRHAGIADEDEGLIQRTADLLTNPEQRRAQVQAARNLVSEHCDPDRVLDLWEAVHASVVRERAGAGRI